MLLVKVSLLLLLLTLESFAVERDETTLGILHALQGRLHVARLTVAGLPAGGTPHWQTICSTGEGDGRFRYFRVVMETPFCHFSRGFVKVGRESLEASTGVGSFSGRFKVG